MTLDYENTQADILTWYRHYLSHTPLGSRQFTRYVIWVGVAESVLLFLLSCFLSTLFPALNLPLLAFLSLIIGSAIGISYYLRRQQVADSWARKYTKQGHFKLFLGPKQLTVSPEGLRISWDQGELLQRWSGIRQIVNADSEHLAIHWSENDFSLIPTRAFGGVAGQDAFLSLVDHHRTAGELGTAPSVAAPIVASLPVVTPTAAPVTPPSPAITTPQTSSPPGPWWRHRDTLDASETKKAQVGRGGQS